MRVHRASTDPGCLLCEILDNFDAEGRVKKPIRGAVLVSAAAVLATAGCGVIFGGTRQSVRVESAPGAAMITTSPSTTTYTTPTTISLERRNNYTLTFEKEGYAPADLEIQRKLRGGILVLDILTGLVGVVVDAATGGWYKLEPKMATVSLERITDRDEGAETIEIEVSLDETSGVQRVRIEPSAPGVTTRLRRH